MIRTHLTTVEFNSITSSPFSSEFKDIILATIWTCLQSEKLNLDLLLILKLCRKRNMHVFITLEQLEGIILAKNYPAMGLLIQSRVWLRCPWKQDLKKVTFHHMLLRKEG